MKKETTTAVLEILERGAKVLIGDKYASIIFGTERDVSMRATEITAIGRSLGERLLEINETIEVPAQWRRFLKNKHCPKYMKEITKYNVMAFYPKLSLPKEEHWVTFEKEDFDV